MATDIWSVVAIVKEPRAVLERFVAWYLHLGADRIILYFDDPEDPGIAHLAHHAPRVQCIPCTPAFWDHLGVDPTLNFTRRQNAACKHGYEQIDEGWVAVVDADELFCPTQNSLGEMLAGIPAHDPAVLIKTAEYVECRADRSATLFRRPMNVRQVERVYGPFAKHMIGNKGMIGHLVGKSITRAGLKVGRAHPHWMCDQNGDRFIGALRELEDGCALLHFYFLNFRDWRRKIEYRVHAMPRGRRDLLLAELGDLLDAGDERALRQIYRNMHQISATQREMMEKRGLLYAPDLDLDAIIAAHFPAQLAAPQRLRAVA